MSFQERMELKASSDDQALRDSMEERVESLIRDCERKSHECSEAQDPEERAERARELHPLEPQGTSVEPRYIGVVWLMCVLVLQSNFSLPPELRDGNSPTVINSPAVYNVPAKAGDCVIFK